MKKRKPIFKIDIDNVREERMKKIYNKIKENNDPNLSFLEKLEQALIEEKTNIYEIPAKKYNINTKAIQEEWENKIQKRINEINDPTLSYYQKRVIALSELKTTTYIIEKIIEKDNEKIEGRIEKEDEKIEEKQDSDSSSTGSSYSDENPNEILHDDGLSIKKIEIPKFNINIEYFIEQKEKMILEKMEKYNQLNLNDFEKRIEVLKNDKTSSSTINLKKYKKFEKIDILKLFDEDEKRITEKMAKKDPNLSDEKKREEVLKEEKTTEVINKTDNINKNDISLSYLNETSDTSKSYNTLPEDDINSLYLNLSKCYDDESTMDSTLDDDKSKEENIFNAIRNKFYLDHKLYDLLLNIQSKNVKTAEKYRIKDKYDYYYSFTYPNDLNTYYITESMFLFGHKKDYGLINDINNNKSIKDESVGLYFCGKVIKDEGIKEEKKCCPNEFICKDCMKLNKEKYFIKNDYLININGRVTRINKGKYHCFGHFLVGNQIEDCINKFTCKACKMLNSIKDYYLKSM
jgi:hypothetical protein